MAGDWIKMRTNLDTDPRVLEMADELGLPELHIVGCLWKLWAWADQHTVDGNAIRVTGVTLDRFTSIIGFADALRKVGWLEGRDGALTFPRFAEHNGQTAKKRAETGDRVKKHRNAKSVTDVTQKVLPEKTRQEKNKKRQRLLNFSVLSVEDMSKRSRVLAWIEKNVPQSTEEVRNYILACSVRARSVGRSPLKLFYNLVETGLTQGVWRVDGNDIDTAMGRSKASG